MPQTDASPVEVTKEASSRTSERSFRSWRRTARDMVLIVVSILIAFALNAWWEGTLEARQERRYLVGVRRELVANRALLSQSAAGLNGNDAATAEIVAHMGPRPSDLAGDSLAALFDYSFRAGVLELPMGAIQGLLLSGGLEVLSSEDLKGRIAAWPASVANARNYTELLVDSREEILRFLNALLPILSVARNTGLIDHYKVTDFPVESTPVLASQELEGLLADRGIRIYNTRLQMQRLAAQADTMISLIDSEVGP